MYDYAAGGVTEGDAVDLGPLLQHDAVLHSPGMRPYLKAGPPELEPVHDLHQA